jgi:hypothetical protein
MSELSKLIEARRTFAKQWKIVGWTFGIAFATYLITDGKGGSEHPFRHLLIGAAIGWVLGLAFSRSLKSDP